jgi:hypothetical protein
VTHIPTDAHEAALAYARGGLFCVPLPFRSKGRNGAAPRGWQKLRLTEATIPDHFRKGEPANVALLLGALDNGEPGGEVVVDLDCPEALRAAPWLLPKTGRVAGRPGNPTSHWHYWAEAAPAKAHDEYLDPLPPARGRKRMIVELLSTGSYVLAPPSAHDKADERYEWHEFGKPAKVKAAELLAAVRTLAAASLLGRYWTESMRHDAALPLAGGLLRAGWTEAEVGQFVRAVCAAGQDREVKDRLAVVRDTKAKLDARDQHVTGWPALAKLLGKNGDTIVSAVRGWLGLTADGAAAALAEPPVPEVPAWPEPPEQEAFFGLPGKIVAAIEPTSEADRTALLAQTLVMFGSVIGRTGHAVVEADRHYCNEYLVLVGRTSKARKGVSYGRVFDLFKGFDPAWTEDCIQSGVATGEGIVWRVRDATYKTVDGVEEVVDPGVTDKRLLIYEPEFASVLKQTERPGNIVSPVLREAWDRGTLGRLTKSCPTKATGAHISLIAHTTAAELSRLLTETEAANGFANRHIFLCAERSKVLPEGGRVDGEAAAGLVAELWAAVEFAKTVGEVTRDAAARELWAGVYGPLSEGQPGLSGAMLARGEAHVLRWSVIYALMDKSKVVCKAHLMAALALWDYAERSVRHVFGDSTGDPIADDTLRLLRQSPDGLTRTDIRNYFGKHVYGEALAKSLGVLLAAKLVRREEKQTGGRPAERWFAT